MRYIIYLSCYVSGLGPGLVFANSAGSPLNSFHFPALFFPPFSKPRILKSRWRMKTEKSYLFPLFSALQYLSHNVQLGTGIQKSKYLIHTHAQRDVQRHIDIYRYICTHRGMCSQTQMHLTHRHRHTEMLSYTYFFLSLGKNMFLVILVRDPYSTGYF